MVSSYRGCTDSTLPSRQHTLKGDLPRIPIAGVMAAPFDTIITQNHGKMDRAAPEVHSWDAVSPDAVASGQHNMDAIIRSFLSHGPINPRLAALVSWRRAIAV